MTDALPVGREDPAIEEMLNSFRHDPEFHRIPKPAWYIRKYNLLAPPKKGIMALTAYALDNTREYGSSVIEVRDGSDGPPAPEIPPASADSTAATETKTQELEDLSGSSLPAPCAGSDNAPDAPHLRVA